MSNPPPYVPSFNFSGFQGTNPTDPPPGPMLDNEFDNISDSLNTTITALSSVRRSDGALVNGIVTLESLASDLTIGIQTATAWVTAKAYVAGNTVVQSNKFYLCLVTHVSGVFATDLAAVKWVEVTLSISGYSADQVTYSNVVSGLAAVNVKLALDEIDAKADATNSAVSLFKPPTRQIYTAGATWARPAGCLMILARGVAAGGGGGGIDGAAGATLAGAGGGGGSGRYGETPFIITTAFTTATVVIGAAGVGGLGTGAAANGTAGGNMTLTANAVVYTWNGGGGGIGTLLNGSTNLMIAGGGAGSGTNLQNGGGSHGGIGHSCGPDQTAVSGAGGGSPFGTGGYHVFRTTNGATSGTNGNNYGSGGSGAAGCNTAGDAQGGAGAGGYMEIWEFYP